MTNRAKSVERFEEFMRRQQSEIDFPVDCPVTLCRTYTRTVITRTPHGIVRKQVQFTIQS